MTINDRPEIQSDQGMVLVALQRRQLRFGIKIGREWLQEDIHQGGASIFGRGICRVRRRPHARSGVLERRQGCWRVFQTLIRRTSAGRHSRRDPGKRFAALAHARVGGW